jgi:uncharacterized membrane protein (GlpM family)
MAQLIIRFLVGGLVVSLFAFLGDILRPKSFAGLFGAAPSVALGTLTLTLSEKSPAYVAVECRSMVLGALALLAYCLLVARILKSNSLRALPASLCSLPVWFAGAFLLLAVLRPS